MKEITFKNNPIKLNGEFPNIGDKAPDFKVVKQDLTEISVDDLKGKKVIFNIFPSIDTPVCAAQLKKFSQEISKADNTLLLFISLDLPFALKRFCAAEGINNAITASDFRYRSLEKNYGIMMNDGHLKGLYARAVIVLDEQQNIVYSEVVSEVTEEPNYQSAMEALNH